MENKKSQSGHSILSDTTSTGFINMEGIQPTLNDNKQIKDRKTPRQIPLLQYPLMTDYVDLTQDQNRHLTQKRRAPDTSLSGKESVDKRRKIQEPDVLFQAAGSMVKPCQLLFHGAMPYEEIYGHGPTIKGVYKIAYKGKAIYVGRDSCNVIKQLIEHFKGNGQRELCNFLENLTSDALQQDVTVYWVDGNLFDHKCGQSYLKCVEYIQRQKPMFNDISRTPFYQSLKPDNNQHKFKNGSNAYNWEQPTKNAQMLSVNPGKAYADTWTTGSTLPTAKGKVTDSLQATKEVIDQVRPVTKHSSVKKREWDNRGTAIAKSRDGRTKLPTGKGKVTDSLQATKQVKDQVRPVTKHSSVKKREWENRGTAIVKRRVGKTKLPTAKGKSRRGKTDEIGSRSTWSALKGTISTVWWWMFGK